MKSIVHRFRFLIQNIGKTQHIGNGKIPEPSYGTKYNFVDFHDFRIGVVNKSKPYFLNWK